MGKRKRTPEPKNLKNAKYLYSVQVLSHPVYVFEASDLSTPEHMGEFYNDDHEAYVLEDAPSGTSRADRELHEILHAISHITLPPELRLNEGQVNTLSLVLVDLIAKNPNFIKRLMKLVAEEE